MIDTVINTIPALIQLTFLRETNRHAQLPSVNHFWLCAQKWGIDSGHGWAGLRLSKRAELEGKHKETNKNIPKELPDSEVNKFKKLLTPTEVTG